MKALLFSIILLYCYTSVAKSHQYKVHTMKNGETISELLKENGITPLYGEKQWVKKVLRINRLTQATAKKLDNGDSIILPVIEDRTSTKLSSTVRAKVTKRDKHNYKLWVIYGLRDYTLSNDANVSVNQAFGAQIDYSYQGLKYSPVAMLKVFNQNSTNFADSYNANFTPSVTLQTGVEQTWKMTTFTPFAEYQFQSALEFNSSYSVRKDHLLWAGLKLKTDYKNSWAQVMAATTIKSIKHISAYASDSLSSTKLGMSLGHTFNNSYLIQMSLKHQKNHSQVDTTFNSIEFSLGIKL